MEREIKLLNEDGDNVSLEEVVDWWLKNYPDTVFPLIDGEGHPVAKIRHLMEVIKRKLNDKK